MNVIQSGRPQKIIEELLRNREDLFDLPNLEPGARPGGFPNRKVINVPSGTSTTLQSEELSPKNNEGFFLARFLINTFSFKNNSRFRERSFSERFL